MNCGLRETNPIFRLRTADGGLAADLRRDASCGLAPGPAWAGCTNKPNSRRRRVGRGHRGAERGAIVRHRLDAPLRETNPVSAQLGRWAGPPRQTNPIPADPTAGAGPVCDIASMPRLGKQSQFRRGDRMDKYLREKELWRIEHAQGLPETKPIFAELGRRAGPPRQTNPIPADPTVGAGQVCDIASMPRFGKQSQTKASWGIWGTGRRRDEHRANAPNKPNLAGGTGGAGRGTLYKQSQLPLDQKEGQVLGGKGVMVNRTSARPQQNKANSRPRRAGRGRWGGDRGAIVRHRLDAPLRETKPIRPRRQDG
jgi:hypothetical protein